MLVHSYAFNSLGLVDRYTDPLGKVQRFLPDALGRLVEHVRVGDGGNFIRNRTEFVDAAQTDGRTMVTRFDGLDNKTITHFDAAGRPFIVQNPGGNTAPTSAAPFQSMSLYAEYDGASRIAAIFDGSGGKTRMWRDGPGRLIQRELITVSAEISDLNTKDILYRDAVGRIFKTDMYGLSSENPPGTPINGALMASEQTDVDSLGRTWEERYQYYLTSGTTVFPAENVISAHSDFSSSSPFRTGLQYNDGLAAGVTTPMALDFTADSVGRLTLTRWNGGVSGAAAQDLVSYGWLGGLRKTRLTKFASGTTPPQDVSSFTYDDYGRLTQIKDDRTLSSGTSTISQFDYEYDAASNLKKEKYTKVGGRVGDRFTYDAYHRLKVAFMGTDSGTMNSAQTDAQLEAMAYNAAQVQTKLTYGIDVANNRSGTTTQDATSSSSETYGLQGAGNAQGPSNRYATINSAALTYDSRGNLTFDGHFVYAYDYLNRLQEVYVIGTAQDLDAMMAAPTSTSSTTGGTAPTAATPRYALVEPTAPENARQGLLRNNRGILLRALRDARDPTFRAQLRVDLPGGLLPLVGGGAGGMQETLINGQMQLVALYVYDAYNRRIVQSIVNGLTLFHAFDGWREVTEGKLEFTATGWRVLPIKEFVWGARLDEMVAFRNRNQTTLAWTNYFLVHGGQDTAGKLLDASGNIVEQYEYDPYGKVTVYNSVGAQIGWASVAGLPFLWKSVRLDLETGLLYMRNRYYSTAMGRFLSTDPLPQWGDAWSLGNEYQYAGSNPLVGTDPAGMQGDLQWHHDLPGEMTSPKLFGERAKELGFGSNAMENGTILPASDHIGKDGVHPDWNADWKEWLTDHPNATPQDVQARLKDMKGSDKYRDIFSRGEKAKVSYDTWSKHMKPCEKEAMHPSLTAIARRLNADRWPERALARAAAAAKKAVRSLAILAGVAIAASDFADAETPVDYAMATVTNCPGPVGTVSSTAVAIVSVVPVWYGACKAASETNLYLATHGCPPCFVAGTVVATAFGDQPIESIRPADVVFGKAALDGLPSAHAVSAVIGVSSAATRIEEGCSAPSLSNGSVIRDVIEIVLDDGEIIVSTQRHRFYVKGRGWVPAFALTMSDTLEDVANVGVRISRVRAMQLSQGVVVYNLRVECAASYYVGRRRVLVHNGLDT
jgi:RHS repeat-associated protein